MKILEFIRVGEYVCVDDLYHEDFGCTEFFEKEYNCYTNYPYQGAETWGAFLTVYEKKVESKENCPRYAVDVCYGDGDVLCFSNSVLLLDYLVHLVPLIKMCEDDFCKG